MFHSCPTLSPSPRSGRKETVTELKAMVSTLQREMSMLQQRASKHEGVAQEAAKAREESISLAARLAHVVSGGRSERGEGTRWGGGGGMWASADGGMSMLLFAS